MWEVTRGCWVPLNLSGAGAAWERCSPELLPGLQRGRFSSLRIVFSFLPIPTIPRTEFIPSRSPHPAAGQGCAGGESAALMVQSTQHPAELVRDTAVAGERATPALRAVGLWEQSGGPVPPAIPTRGCGCAHESNDSHARGETAAPLPRETPPEKV